MHAKRSVGTIEAAQLLEMTRVILEQWLRMGNCPFGAYIRLDGKKQGSYYINRNRLEAYITAQDMRGGCPYVKTTHDPLEAYSDSIEPRNPCDFN